MKFAILGINHETNTFSVVPTTYSEFQKSGILRGQQILDEFRDSNYTIAGYLQAAEELGFEAIPLMYASTGPIGTITKDAYDKLTDEMLAMLRNEGPWQGVLISNHGAAVSEEFPDMDGEFTRAVRETVGDNVPVGITFDMHSNISKAVVENTDICVVWRTNPHLDPKPRGRKTAELIFRSANGEIHPRQWIEMPPVVVNIVRQFTGDEPMKSIVDDCISANERQGILDTSVAEGYPYSDVAEMGMSWIAISDNDIEEARKAACWMASRAWEKRMDLNKPAVEVKEALKMAMEKYLGPRVVGDEDVIPADGSALEAPESTSSDRKASRTGPIILMDVGDNIGGGSSADSTFILAEAQRMGISSFLQTLYDPEAVAICVKSGVGTEVDISVGAKTDSMHGEPVSVTGIVRTITDGRWEDTRPTHGGGRYFDGGVSVRLDTTDGHTILLTSNRIGNTSREQMYSVGIYPEKFKIVVAKGVVSPRPAYQPIAGEVILVNTGGVTTSDLNYFTYQRRRKPLYPFEDNAQYNGI